MNAAEVVIIAALIAHFVILKRHRKIGAEWSPTYRNRILVIVWIAGNWAFDRRLVMCFAIRAR